MRGGPVHIAEGLEGGGADDGIFALGDVAEGEVVEVGEGVAGEAFLIAAGKSGAADGEAHVRSASLDGRADGDGRRWRCGPSSEACPARCGLGRTR